MKKFLLIFVISSQLLLSQNSINISSDPVSVDEDFFIGIVFSNADDRMKYEENLEEEKKYKKQELYELVYNKIRWE